MEDHASYHSYPADGLGNPGKVGMEMLQSANLRIIERQTLLGDLAGAEPTMCYETSALAMPPKPHGDIIVPSAPPPIVQSCHTELVFHV